MSSRVRVNINADSDGRRYKEWAWGRSVAGNVGSNPARGLGLSLL